MKELSYSDAPRDWGICLQTDCPLAATCLRHRVAELCPTTVKRHVVVMPSARKGDECSAFVNPDPIVLAYGLKCTFTHVSKWHLEAMLPELKGYFGSHSTYYRYYNGQRALTPADQRRVAALLKKYGYKDAPKFDKTIETYDFTNK